MGKCDHCGTRLAEFEFGGMCVCTHCAVTVDLWWEDDEDMTDGDVSPTGDTIWNVI